MSSRKARQFSAEATVYHELRSALGLMAVAAQEAQLADDPEDVREQCGAIERTAQRLLRLVNCLLYLDRGKDGEPETFNPAAVVSNIIDDTRRLGRPIVMTIRTRRKVLVSGSVEAFEALVNSILGNCVDHSDPSSEIAVAITLREGQVRIAFRNISAEGRHAGRKMGSTILARLSEHIGATLESYATFDTYTVTIAMPAIVVHEIPSQKGSPAASVVA